MATQTVEPERLVDPPTIPDEQLERMWDGEPPCEMWHRSMDDYCGRPAEVFIRGTCGECRAPARAVICRRCLDGLGRHNGHPHALCSECNGVLCIEQVTPL